MLNVNSTAELHKVIIFIRLLYPNCTCLVVFLQSWVEQLLAWLGIKPTTSYLDYQSGGFNHP